MKIKILAIDTATAACSAALYIDGKVTERYHFAPRLHGDLILTLIDELLHTAQLSLKELDALAYGCGPGSFTGVRMAASIVQGLALGAHKPVIAVSSLQAMAHQLYLQLGYTQIACAFDARMQEVYWGAYRFQANEWECVGGEGVYAPNTVPLLGKNEWIGAGEGWAAYEQPLKAQTHIETCYPRCYPHARELVCFAVLHALKGEYRQPSQALPIYLRNDVVR